MSRNSFRDPAGEEISCGFYFWEEDPLQRDLYELKPVCKKPATLAGIYFAFWHAYERHRLPFPRRNGLFNDSLWVFSCERHLDPHLRIVPQQFGVLENPEIIVDAQLDLEEEVYHTFLPKAAGKAVPKDYFTARRFYEGRENLRELWKKEKKDFKF